MRVGHVLTAATRYFAAGRASSLRVVEGGGPSRRSLRLLGALAATAFAVLALGASSALAAAPETPEVHFLEGEPTIGSTKIVVFGVLDPGLSGGGQEPLTYEFLSKESPTACAGGVTTPPMTSNGSGHQEVSEFIEGLTPDTQYTVCLRARNASSEASVSAPLTFKTLIPEETPEASPATQITSHSARLNGVLSPHSPHSSVPYNFIYVPSTTGCQVGNESYTGRESSAGGEAEAVSSEISGLLPATTYAYCLVTHIPFEENVSAPRLFTTAATVPSVVGGTALEVGTSTATLGAKVNSEGLATGYFVEYVTESQFQASGFSQAASAPVEPVELPALAADEPVQVTLSGLSPATAYHFRFHAENELGPATGPAATFRTYALVSVGPESCPNAILRAGALPPELPDCRAAELVSTSGIFGEPYYPFSPLGPLEVGQNTSEYLIQAADDGEAIAYVGEPPETGGNGNTGNGNGQQWLASRTPDGWKTGGITPGQAFDSRTGGSGFGFTFYQAFSANLSQGYLMGSGHPLSPEIPSGCQALYSRDTETGAFRALFNLGESPELTKPFRVCGSPLFAGASQSGSQVIFQSEAALTPEAIAAPQGPPRYEHGEAQGLSGNPCAYECNLYYDDGGQLRLVNILEGVPVPNASFGGYPGEARATSEGSDNQDLSNVISEDGSRIFWTDTEPGADFEHVYVFKDGTTNVPVSTGAARYWTATPNGRYAFYTEAGALWKFDTNEDTREEITPPGYVGVLGVIGTDQTSGDAQYVYFVAEANLGTPANAEGETPSEGAPNLYVIHNGVTTFIATLSFQDDNVLVEACCNGHYGGDWKGDLGLRTAAVSPDGRHLIFESSQPLTGYTNVSAQDPRPIHEVYVYSADDDALICASCAPTGVPPSVSETNGQGPEPRLQVSKGSNVYLHRWMSNDGSRVFFNTEQALSPSDTNGTQDVYEWEREGSGSCTAPIVSPVNHGCVFLLSEGNNSGFSFLLDADEEGNNVFLEHAGPLGRIKSQGGNNEIYDLRVGGGIEEVTTTPCSSGEACRGALPTPPSVQSAGTASFQANEPPPPIKCKKGFVKKTSKCVTKKSRTKKHHKKSNKQKGKKQGRANSNHGGQK
jgi:hypothetical protein